MEIQQVRYFVALCETLNFTRAAERCNVTQPSLTRAIKQLEEELGGPLLHRERNRTHLTELGRLMRPYLEHMLHEAEAARAQARDYARLERGTLRLGLMCSIGPTRLLPLLAAFTERHPGVEVILQDGEGHLLCERLLAGELEVAIFGLPEPLPEELHASPLFGERFLITVAPGHRLAALPVVRAVDLHDERYLNRATCEFFDHIDAQFRERGVQTRCVCRSNRDDWVQAMVLAGLGFGITPEGGAMLPGVVARPLVDPEVQRTISVATVRGRPHSPAVGAFVRQTMAWRAQGCPGGTEAPLAA
jgi:DNA-binding transcriptional LysR family regulator